MSDLASAVELRGRRERVRAAGLDPDYWYAVEHDGAVRPGQVVEVTFWGSSIALYRGADGRAPCAGEPLRPPRSSSCPSARSTDCALTCAYHGWSYAEDGRLATIPHDLFGRADARRSGSAHTRSGCATGSIWLFPGDPALADQRAIPDIPELEGPDRWACVPIDFRWRAHHSIIIDNVSDFTHAWLHRKYQPFVDAKLTRLEAVGDRVRLSYDTQIGTGRISRRFVDRRQASTPTRSSSCYEYPYQWSNTGGKIKHWCFVLPIDARDDAASSSSSTSSR